MSPLDAEDLAKELANNWKKFGSYMRWESLPDGFAIVYTSNRDSDALARSNARVIARALAPFTEGEDPDVRDESSSHWACGHTDGFAIRVRGTDGTLTAAFLAYANLACAMADYPVLSDEDFSEEEQREADATWARCYSASERIEYIRKHRDQFTFHDFTDLLSCVRGHFFAGYASELCS